MTTNTMHSVPAPAAGPSRRTSLWLPRSPDALGVLALTVVAAAWPLSLAAAWSWINATGCFFDCIDPDPLRAAALAALAAVIAMSPFAAVRLYQSRTVPIAARVGVILAVDVAAIAFSAYWLWWPLA